MLKQAGEEPLISSNSQIARREQFLLILNSIEDRIPEGELLAAQRFLEYPASNPVFRAALAAPPDNEPVTSAMQRLSLKRRMTHVPVAPFPTTMSFVNLAYDEVRLAGICV